MTVETTITPTKVVFPWKFSQRDFEVDVNQTSFPRSEMRFSVINGTIGDGDAGGQIVNYNCAMDQNYSYVLLDCFLSIRRITGNNGFDPVALGFLIDDQSGVSDSYNLPLQLVSQGIATGTSSRQFRIYTLSACPKLTIIPPPGVAPSLTIGVANSNASETSYDTNLLVRFAMYNIDQGFDYRINSPTLVR